MADKKLFRKKPVVIEAIQWDGTLSGIDDIISVFPDIRTVAKTSHPPTNTCSFWKIGTLEGSHEVSAHDFVIRGVKGEYYPCKPDIFVMTYEPATATPPADAAMADEWNIEDLLATAVMYMRDVGMPNEADAITELQRRNAALRARAVPAAAVRSEPFLNFNLTQAMALVESFGGLDGDMAVSWFAKANDAETGEPMPEGLYAYCYDYPEEGRTWLGDPMAEIAHAPAAKPVAVPDDAVRAELHAMLAASKAAEGNV